MDSKKWLQNLILFLVLLFLSGTFFFALYLYDNKYSSPVPVSQDGIALLDENNLSRDVPAYLVDGWKLYPDQLLTPAQIASTADTSSVTTYIGQFLNLSAFHRNKDSYGTATYRLLLHYDGAPATFSLLLPEIYSSSKVYVNGELVGQTGSISPYQPQIKDLVCSFTLTEDTELVVQTANYTHYYSGMTFPPVLGSAACMYTMNAVRMIFYGFLCFFSLAIALFTLPFWTQKGSRHHRLSLCLGVLVLSFCVRILYPFIHLLGLGSIRLLYTMEDAASMLGIFCILAIVLLYMGIPLSHGKGAMLCRCAGTMLLVSIIVPLAVLPVFPTYTFVYGKMISIYKLLVALLLICLTFYSSVRQNYKAKWLLGGVTIYGTSLFAGTVLINRYEPAYTGWLDEYGVFALVLCFSMFMFLENRSMIAENESLTFHLQEEVELKTQDIAGLINERQRFLSEFLHDLKSPMASILTYTQLIQENQIQLDPDTASLLTVIEDKCSDMAGRIKTMQDFTVENNLEFCMEPLDLYLLLQQFHHSNQPDVELDGIDFLFSSRLTEGACMILGNREKLLRMLENLVYNAVAATPADGTITLTLRKESDHALITVSDTGCGIAPEEISHVFNRFYTNRPNGKGLGLYIVKTIVTEHKGTIDLHSVPSEGTSFIISIPLLHQL
ncbi:Signal transduction histidine kinase [Hespellia stercorisuis DSM 15480]|uniref:histidine kinase n=1 Tax=Hespellia stercorisuis DSM 15480 TaxID=1121950 RepID=A0A1M6WA21_9FIRM|nr:Signal transduction histidine kinase [Hespellia stercorisuis DSM 15480]